ncbi:MATE family efflux transporter [Sphingobium sp. CR2-8]|uniref:MATE family efflux transporter n=1 Tax=Sphingobium sp. CR2-8 TaxID=1306534 RepID=UPI002DB673D0|nr:MATE family efflux transporter [Sphingobium sp. CR2-8]MEC3909220.1 MATE family efflux transporter [Sphingobium sp. CR2-8]
MTLASKQVGLADLAGSVENARATSAHTALLDGPVVKPLLMLALPTITMILTQIGVGVAEVYYIGRLGTAALAGASLVFPFYMLMSTMSAGGLGSGVSSAAARAMGADRRDDVQRIFAHAIMMALIVGLSFTALMLILGPWIYRSLAGSGAALDAAVQYSNIIFAGIVFMWVNNLLGAAFRGIGNPRLPARIALVGAVIVVPASPVLIFGLGPIPPMGIAGAAAALVLYQIGAMVALLHRWLTSHGVALDDFRPRRSIMLDIVRVGVPSSLSAAQTSLMSVVLTGMAARFGTDALAAYGIASRLDSTMVPVLFGLASAVLTMSGMNASAGRIDRAQRIAWAGAGLGMIATGLPGIVFAIWPQLWLGMFSNDLQVLAAAAMYLRITAPFYPLLALGFVLSFAAQGAGHSLWPAVGVTARVVLTVAVGWIAIEMLGFGFPALGVAAVTGLIGYAAVCFGAMRSGAVWRGRR